MKRSRLLIILLAFGLSGFAALTYQITWIRELGGFFGIQVYSTTTVLTAFMAGLAFGSWIFGRIADRCRKPILLFVLMEVGLAIYALIFPWIKELISAIYHLLHDPGIENVLYSQFIRFVASFPILLVATSLMGGTLPVLTRALTPRIGMLGSRVSVLYGSNNFGAFLGGFITGYILISSIGISGAMFTGAACNALNALIVYISSEKATPYQLVSKAEKTAAAGAPVPPPAITGTVLWVFALEGFTTLAYEIIWSRIMHEFSYDKSTYFYTTIIITFVGGLSIGSYIISLFINRIRDKVRALAAVELGIGILYLMLFGIFLLVAPFFHEYQEAQTTWFRTVGTEQLLIFLFVAPPVVLMGFTLPLVAVIYNNSAGSIGRGMGLLGALDTVGSVFGSVVTGFLLIPLLGTVKSFLLVVLINLLLGGWILAAVSVKPLFRRVLPAVFALLIFALVLVPKNTLSLNMRWNSILTAPVIYYNEGSAASVAVTEYGDSRAALSINGAITAYTITNDVQVHKLLATLPWLYSEKPERALVIGLGIGITANTLQFARVPSVDIAEISPEVMEVSRKLFGYFNEDAPGGRVSFFLEDGRAFLFRTEKRYDIITTNSIHPRLGNTIYTREFYKICAARMNPEGVICQWLPTNWMTVDEFKSLVRAVTDVFTYASLWISNDAHVILLASRSELDHSVKKISIKLKAQPLKEYLGMSYFMNEIDILKHFTLDDPTLRSYVRESPVNKDNRPRVEYSRVVSRAPNKQLLQELVDQSVSPAHVFYDMVPGSNQFMLLESEHAFLMDRLQGYIEILEQGGQ